MNRNVITLALLAPGLIVCSLRAEPPPTLPSPRPAPEETWAPPVHAVPIIAPRPSAYSVWQYYAVDRQGYFRLRVAYQPGHGSYYLYNGRPYPWVTTQSLNVQPFSAGTPYRSYMPYAHD